MKVGEIYYAYLYVNLLPLLGSKFLEGRTILYLSLCARYIVGT